MRFHYRGGSFQFTPFGTRFVLMALAVGAAAINTGNNLLYLILAMMLSLILFSGYLSRRLLRHLRVERSLPAHCFANTPLSIYVRVMNRNRWSPAYSFSVREAPDPGLESKPHYIYRLAPYERVLSPIGLSFHRRGRHLLRGIQVETAFPFGFFQKGRVWEDPREVVVYPRLMELPPQLAAELASTGGSRERPIRGTGSSVRSLRDYTPLDDARSIHWKASAKQSRLLLKEYEQEDERRLILCLGNHLPEPSAPGDREAFEEAVSLTASIAYYWILSGYAVQVRTLTQETPMGRDLPHLFAILHLLALVEPVPSLQADAIPFGASTDLWIPQWLVLPREDPFWEGRRSAFARVVAAGNLALRSSAGVSGALSEARP